jgi:DNA segregation ATPase FtsK/SpoIIIE-like protein
VPLTIGDRLYSPENGRAELQLSSGNFVRLAPRSYFTTLNLSDDIKQFYLGEGSASFNIKRLQSDEVIEIDTPNVSVTLDEPGKYRVTVDDDGNSRIIVRRGRVSVAAGGRQIEVENSEVRVYGIDSPRYEIVALPATDVFDHWASERDDRYERSYAEAYRHASEDIIGVEDLVEYGRWEDIPEFGYAWTPSRVATGWAPFSAGRWFWQDPWGWTWISSERWGWATSHYGRWVPYRSRWYWVPVRPRTRVVYLPAAVQIVRVGNHVGWFPLHPRDRYIPWWDRRARQQSDRNVVYVNRTYVTIVNQNTFISARPVHKYLVRDAAVVRQARSARFAEPLPIPNRSSLRIVSESGERRTERPSAKVLNRAAVVRTAPPAPPPTFRQKLPEIQKSQGKPIEPSAAGKLVAKDDKAKSSRMALRPAVDDRGDFAPRDPGKTAGPAPQAVTAAKGKKLATRDSVDRGEAASAPQKERQSTPEAPTKGAVKRAESPTPQPERDGQRQERQSVERKQQNQQQKQEVERKGQEQTKERKTQLQQQQEQERREQLKQQQRDLERKRQTEQQEKERKAQIQEQQEERRQEASRRELQERQAREEQKQQALERQQEQQRDAERKAELQKGRQEQERREKERQQQQEQERKAQRQQQLQDQARRQQLRQQQERESQDSEPRIKRAERGQRDQDRAAQVKQQQQQQQSRQQQLPLRQAPESQRQPG